MDGERKWREKHWERRGRGRESSKKDFKSRERLTERERETENVV